MPQPNWPRGLVRRRSEKFQLSRGERRKQDGQVTWSFSPKETIYGLLRPPTRNATDAQDFEIGESGESVSAQFILDVLEKGETVPGSHIPDEYIVDPQIEIGDRLHTERGNYRVADSTFMFQEGFGRYALIEDMRGDASNNDSSGSDDPPYQIA